MIILLVRIIFFDGNRTANVDGNFANHENVHVCDGTTFMCLL